ncbi:hypothetical protein Ddye_014264 [Dipteronia dyeriana]|uniref:Pectinesterase n=1 Tax=Dipteronia dyeriana TaxID=168575 RepID=A0AAD9X808_9ROSI|nr:hypothetical protein Ddye_014264 [Dipteronia dyeriana]
MSSLMIIVVLVLPITPATPAGDNIGNNVTNSSKQSVCNSSLLKSLSKSVLFSNIVERYIQIYRPILSKAEVRVMEDCSTLAALNTDYLSASLEIINSAVASTTKGADDVQCWLSAILTNLQTCFDGLQATVSAENVNNGLSTHLLNDIKVYGASLSLVTRACDQKKGTVPMSMSVPQPTKEQLDHHQRQTNYTTFYQVLVRDIMTVSQDGRGNFSTITDAINAAENNSDGRNGYLMIYVNAGVYEEYISIAQNKKYLLMKGAGINKTVITGCRSVADGWSTFNSATFAVMAPNFVMMGITVRNTAGAIKGQAVALRSGAHYSTFYQCSFEGYQDTLYVLSIRQFYRECDIYGTVDFIFGNAAVVLQNCNIYPRLPITGQFNAITAQSRTHPSQNTGIIIHNCTIRAADDLASSSNHQNVQTYLGRPWNIYSRTVYMQSFMDSLINPDGWHIWTINSTLSRLYYAEFDNTGPGSNISNRVKWPIYHVINTTDAANFTVSKFLTGDAWLPKTEVPYNGGLI